MAVRGAIIVVSSPSGAGKHTILKQVMQRDGAIEYSVSATSRPPRRGESDGREYFFLERDEFERRVEAGAFAEWAEVHGNLYGTLCSELERVLASGKDVLLELDVQGMRSIKAAGFDIVSVFIMPPSVDELRNRLEKRGTDSEDVIELRLRNARAELAAQPEYEYTVVNDEVERAVADFEAIVRAQRCKTTRIRGESSGGKGGENESHLFA